MKALFAILFLSLIVKAAYSQTPYMDNLKKGILSKSVEDTQRVLLLSDLAYAMSFIRPDSAMLYVQQGVNLARKIGYVKGEEDCKFSLGWIMRIAGEYSKANELFLQALKYAESINDLKWQINIYKALSSNNRDQENYEEGLKYSYKAIELVKSNEQLRNELGLCYLEIGAIYQEMNISDSALYYLQQLNLPNTADNSGYNGFKFLMIGRTYAKMENDALALKYYKLSIEALSTSNNYKDFATAYNSLAKLYKKEGKTDSCIYYAKKGFDIAQRVAFKKGVFETSLFLSEIYEKTDPGLSLTYFKIATAAKDSMFNLQKTTQFLNAQFNEQMRQQEEETNRINYRNKIRTYALLAALSFFLLLAIILYRSNRHKQTAKKKVESAYEQLKSTQQQLIQSEKMASLGELTAGIAHEIQNPLNFVNNFAEVNAELVMEMKEELAKGNTEEAIAIANNIDSNEKKIIYHGKRADAIVKNMLQHSRSNSGKKEPTNINALADEYLRLAYHGLRARDKSFNATFKTDFDNTIGNIDIIPQDIGRVLLNLFTNAFYSVAEKNKEAGAGYEPTVSVSTKKIGNMVRIIVRDNGLGVPQKLMDKIFQPFFTTKPTGEGTGLGLSLSYDIVTKGHGGELNVYSKNGDGAEFIILLPL